MRAMLVLTMVVAGCGAPVASAALDLSAAACPLADLETAADLAMAADLWTAPDIAAAPDMAVCFSVACPRASACGDYINQTADTEYITCCTAGDKFHCHDALGMGETCERSICQPGATCLNGLPNGGATALVMVCCSSPASAPAMRCAVGS